MYKSLLLIFMLLFANSLAADDKLQFTGSNYQLFLGADLKTAKMVFQTDSSSHFFTEYQKYYFSTPHWIQWDVELAKPAPSDKHYEYFISMLGAFEMYWNGELVGKNGVVGESQSEEVPGEIEISFVMPTRLLKVGKNVQQFKISNHHRPKGYSLFRHAFIEEYNIKSKYINLGSLFPTLLVSISLFMGLYLLMLFFIDKLKLAFLFLSLACITVFIFGYSIQWPHLIGYSYDWAIINNYVSLSSGALFPVFLIIFYLYKNDFQKYWYGLLLLPVLYYLLTNTVLANLGYKLYWGIAFVLCAVILILKYQRDKQMYWWELFGLFVGIIFVSNTANVMEDLVTVFPVLLILILMTNLLEIQNQIRQGYLSQLRAVKLEASLLRKNIQPHFILNSLTSLIEWVETAPDKSVDFITSLAEEFRLFSEISDKKLIPLSQEVELCRHHLEIMEFRLQRDYNIYVDNNIDNAKIPPGIILTLVENAFSHNDYSKRDVEFRISVKMNTESNELTMTSPIEELMKSEFKALGTGMGDEYIRAQLTQAYGEQWSYESFSEDNFWYSKFKLGNSEALN